MCREARGSEFESWKEATCFVQLPTFTDEKTKDLGEMWTREVPKAKKIHLHELALERFLK